MGIDALFNIVAIGAFLVGVAGIGLVVANASRNQSVRGGVILAIVGFLLGVVSLVVAEGLLVVGPTERVVVFNTLSGELESPREPGLHVIIPGIQQTFPYRVSRQEYTMSGIASEGNVAGNDAIEARSVDGQEVLVDVTIIYTIDPENVNEVHRNWSDAQRGYEIELIRPTVRSITRDVIATARAEEIFGSAQLAPADGETEPVAQEPIQTDENGIALPNPSPNSRAEVQAEIERLVFNELAEEGFTVVEVLLREINFSADFIQAIENRQVAELERDRAEVQAETARIEAGGLADARIEEARGEAEAVRVQAEAEAEALRLVSEQIAANPNLIQYTYVTELSDNVSVVLVPSNSPFLFDASTFTDLGEDFNAPESTPRQETTNETEGN
ncbi:MAG: SPFH domain-containing protein [Chloroflexota bacterium]